MAALKIEVNLSQSTFDKIEEIISNEVESITVDTISSENLASDLLESDVDKYLALKDERPSKMSKSEKYKKASELLADQVSKTGRKTAVDTHFYEMAIQARLVAERAEKEIEIHTAVRQKTSSHRSKQAVTKMRSEIENLENYNNKSIQKELKASKQEIKERKTEKHGKNLVLKVDKLVKETSELQDTVYYTQVLVSLKPLIGEAMQVINEAEEKVKEEQARLQAGIENRLKNEQEQVKQSVGS